MLEYILSHLIRIQLHDTYTISIFTHLFRVL